MTTTGEERAWASVAHAGTVLCACAGMGALVPVMVLILKGRESRYIRDHATESVNFQLSVLLYALVCVILMLVQLGGLLLLVLVVLAAAAVVTAAVQAARGRDFRYPLIFRIIRPPEIRERG